MSATLDVHQLESRLVPAVAVTQFGGVLAVEGGDADDSVVVSRSGGQTVVDIEETTQYETGFDDLTEDGSDAVDFFVGPAFFEQGAAGTRNFPPGYDRPEILDAFALISEDGQSRVVFETPADFVKFAAKDIVELGDAVPGFENVDGTLTLVGEDGTEVAIEMPN